MAAAPPPAVPAERSPGLRRLTFYSLLTSLTPIVPIPFLDDWILRLLRERLVAELARTGGLRLDAVAVERLALGERRWSGGGCMRSAAVGCVLKLTVYLVKKVFRKVIVVLLVKDCVDAFSTTFHEGYLLRHAFEHQSLAGALAGGGFEAAAALRADVEAVCAEVDPRPFEKLVRGSLRGSGRLLRRASRLLVRLVRPLRRRARGGEEVYEEIPLEAEESLLGGLVDSLTHAISRERGYLRQLEERLEARLAQRGA